MFISLNCVDKLATPKDVIIGVNCSSIDSVVPKRDQIENLINSKEVILSGANITLGGSPVNVIQHCT